MLAEKKQVFRFTGEDRQYMRSVGENRPFCPSYGFWFRGDETRPRGLYSNDGRFYGNNGSSSEMDLVFDELMRCRARLVQSIVDITMMAPSLRTFQAASVAISDINGSLSGRFN